MSFRDYVLRGAIVFLLMYAGCKESPTEPTTTQQQAKPSVVKGTVVDSLNRPLADAIIVDQGSLGLSAVSNTSGAYRFETASPLTAAYSTTLFTYLQGYLIDTMYVTFPVNDSLSLAIRLRRDYTQSPPAVLGKPARIRLVSIGESIISAQGIGGQSSTSFTFQVVDAFSVPIGIVQQDSLVFTLSDTSDEKYIMPGWAMTDGNGMATGVIYSGTIYGTPTITASMYTTGTTGTTLISSAPVPVKISGPILSNFVITLSRKNLPGLSQMGVSVGELKMQIGDKDGNPVLSGSVVTFSTTGGMVDARAVTAVDGSASAKLYGGALPTDPVRGVGYGYVTARIQGDSGTTLTQRMLFLFSGEPVISVPAYPTDILPTMNDGGGTGYVDFTIADSNGNPISAGNNVTVVCEGEAAAEMQLYDASYTTEDTWDTLKTHFRFRAEDKSPNSGGGGRLRFKIIVTGDAVPQGGSVVKVLESYLLPPGVVGGSSSGFAKTIFLVDPLSQRSIYVRGTDGTGTGRIETATLVFEVRDSLGRLIDGDHAALMRFEFVGDSLGAQIMIRSNTTDPSGRVTTLVRSGSYSGVPIVRAYTITYGDTVRSDLVSIIVSTGFADQLHFSISAQQFNFPGLWWDNLEDWIMLRVGDYFGNPVPIGTPVYYSCTHGVIETREAYTDKVGYVKQRLFSSDPRPNLQDGGYVLTYGSEDNEPGFMYVRAWTRGENGAIVQDSLYMLWSGPPVSPYNWGTVTRDDKPIGYAPATPDTFWVPHLGSAGPWHFQIRDNTTRGNPLSSGTTITVSCGSAGSMSGYTSATLPDAMYAGPGITDFTVAIEDVHKPTDAPSATGVYTIIKITVNHKIYGEFTYTLATGRVY